MRAKLSILLASTLFVFAGSRAAFAASSWINTTGGTLDWNTSGNWAGSFPPALADDVRITNDLGSAQFITNMGGASAIATTNIINFLAVSNGLGSASVTVQQAAGVFWRTSFGMQLGQNATLILVTNAVIGTNNNVTFNLRPSGQAGSLILSNASPTSGFSTFLVALATGTPTNGLANAGTIQFKPNGNQLVSMNYGQTAAFTNDALGTIVMNGTGTGAFIGNFGGQNRSFLNSGSIFVSAGTLRIDTRDAFSRGGFQNAATGYIQPNTGGVFEIRRTVNAWANGPAVTNFGKIFMNGGSMVAIETDSNGNTPVTNAARVVANVGTIQGNGTITASINSLSGSFVAPGFGFGTLKVGGNVSLGSNSTLVIELGLLAGQTDLLAVGSNLTLNASSILNLSGGAVGNVYTVATAFAVSGIFGSVTPGYTVLYDPTDITVQLVPEPSTLLLVAFGLVGTVALRRRRA